MPSGTRSAASTSESDERSRSPKPRRKHRHDPDEGRSKKARHGNEHKKHHQREPDRVRGSSTTDRMKKTGEGQTRPIQATPPRKSDSRRERLDSDSRRERLDSDSRREPRDLAKSKSFPRREKEASKWEQEENSRKRNRTRETSTERRRRHQDPKRNGDGNRSRDRRDQSDSTRDERKGANKSERDERRDRGGRESHRSSSPDRSRAKDARSRGDERKIFGEKSFAEKNREPGRDQRSLKGPPVQEEDERKFGLQKKVKFGAEGTDEERSKPVVGNDWSEVFKPKPEDGNEAAPVEMEKPNFAPSGKLAADTNTYKGVVIKYNEPSDARKPKLRWRLYPFKGDDTLDVLYIHRQSAYLVGRDRRIADLPVDHPSCSKQHAVFQYRLVRVDLDDGTTVRRVKPYIMDLGSANGTFLNGEQLEPQRFVELREKDVLKFGFSTREFVLLNEKSGQNSALSEDEAPKHSPASSP